MHRVALHHECLVDSHIAGFEFPIGVDTELGLVLGVVEPFVDPLHLLVAKFPIFLAVTFNTGIVRVQTGF